MRNMQTVLLLLSLIAADCFHAGAQDWKKLELLKSTRAHVEAVLGHAPGDYFAQYGLKEGSLFIQYSSGPCRSDRKGGWDVPENVVVNIRFVPRQKRKVAELKLESKKFRKVVDQHVIGVIYYINYESGVTYEVQGGKVDAVGYDPPKRYDHLYCGDAPQP